MEWPICHSGDNYLNGKAAAALRSAPPPVQRQVLQQALSLSVFKVHPIFLLRFLDGILNAWAICMDNPVLVREAFAAAVIPTGAASHASVVRRPDEGGVLLLITTLVSACTVQLHGT